MRAKAKTSKTKFHKIETQDKIEIRVTIKELETHEERKLNKLESDFKPNSQLIS